MMKIIGVPVVILNGSWLGGVNYYKSLLKAIGKNEKAEIKIKVLTNQPDLFLSVESNNVDVVNCKYIGSNAFFMRMLRFILGESFLIYVYALINKVDYISHCPPSKLFFRGRTLFWMPDFQHKHYPELFTNRECKRRDKLVNASIRAGSILLSSQNAKDDLLTYYADADKIKIHVMPFVPDVDFESECTEGLISSGLGESLGKYFFLPNQFWKHKNHIVVAEALSILPSEYKVVCSGQLNDARGSNHINHLLEYVAKNDLKDRFVILGLIDRNVFTYLIQNCIAVINPSAFEGWSTTVEEAKYYGKQIILSDIPVHREQNPPLAYYFNLNSKESLSSAMQCAYENYYSSLVISENNEKKYIHEIAVKEFGERYANVLHSLISHTKRYKH